MYRITFKKTNALFIYLYIQLSIPSLLGLAEIYAS